MYTLILTLFCVGHIQIEHVPDFSTIELCQKAAKTWTDDIKKTRGENEVERRQIVPTAVCVNTRLFK